MKDVGATLVGIFGAIITLAIISVIISRKSRAPEAIQALATGLANVVNAAVRPVQSSSALDRINNVSLSQIIGSR